MTPTYSIFKKDESAGQGQILKDKQVTIGKGESKCIGVSVECDKTECVFEFSVYTYAGKHHPNEETRQPPAPNGDLETLAEDKHLPLKPGPPLGQVLPLERDPPMGCGPPRPPPWAKSNQEIEDII